MKKFVKIILCLSVALMPSRVKIFIFNRFMGGDVHPSARIGFSFIDVKKIKLGAHSRIGHLNFIRGLDLLEMGEYATMHNQNSVTAQPLAAGGQFGHETARFPALVMGMHSAIVKKHFFDCNNTIRIGAFATVSGIGSAFFTHGINVLSNRQETAPIMIGDYSMVGAMCVVLKGGVLPERSVLGANSTLHKAFTEPYGLYSGVPAAWCSTYDRAAAHFHREKGYVD